MYANPRIAIDLDDHLAENSGNDTTSIAILAHAIKFGWSNENMNPLSARMMSSWCTSELVGDRCGAHHAGVGLVQHDLAHLLEYTTVIPMQLKDTAHAECIQPIATYCRQYHRTPSELLEFKHVYCIQPMQQIGFTVPIHITWPRALLLKETFTCTTANLV